MGLKVLYDTGEVNICWELISLNMVYLAWLKVGLRVCTTETHSTTPTT